MASLAVVEQTSPTHKTALAENPVAVIERNLGIYKGLNQANNPYTIQQRIELAELIQRQANLLVEQSTNERKTILKALGVG